MKKLPFAMLILLLVACGSSPEEIRDAIPADPGQFSGYWYQGKAEITRYVLKQARYGEIHEGDAVLIFVTEDLLEDLQVKRDHGNKKADPVLKLNFTKVFDTGLYPYSLMTSTFSKVGFDEVSTPKVSFSGQEWCGHVYSQLNRRGNGYEGTIHSYFQDEADQTIEIDDVLLEDAIWTTIRIAPDKLPLGNLKILASLEHSRLRHHPIQPEKAKATIDVVKDKRFSKDQLHVYTLEYQSGRSLSIYFEQAPPHRIKGWEETVMSGFGDNAKRLSTVATMTHSIFEPYWQMNSKSHSKEKTRLGLE